jgi:hypothetical protein
MLITNTTTGKHLLKVIDFNYGHMKSGMTYTDSD